MTIKKQRRPQTKRKSEVIKVYENSLGNVSMTCRSCSMARETFYRWLHEDEKFKASIIAIDESLIDFSESMLLKNIREGKEASIFFHLKTKGKSRGYIETVENNVTINPFLELMKTATGEDK